MKLKTHCPTILYTKMFVTFFVVNQVLLIVITNVQGRKGIGDSEQDWGYVTVRPNANIFWWLYCTTHKNVSHYTERPLVIWLQGGPGIPSSGYGNFLEIGPLNAGFHKREGSFVENFNVLFVDNPVGVGYSYFSDENATLSKTGEEIAEDMYNFLKIFINTHHPEFQDVPIHVFGESYGGKMATEFVYKLKLSEETDKVKFCNIKTLALGGSYISPIDYVTHYAALALYLGLTDKRGFTQINNCAKKFQQNLIEENFKKAAYFEDKAVLILARKILYLDLNNFLSITNSSNPSLLWDRMLLLEPIMNNQVKKTLNISENIMWYIFNQEIYESLREDSPRSVTDKIEILLNTTDVKVIVYNGILDFITNTAGTVAWLDRLQWHGREKWHKEKRNALIINEVSEGYFKRVDNLALYAILRAGHSVPMDNLPVLNEILRLESLI